MSTSIAQDAWALQFINVFRVQQLIEAIDDDISSFVTVTEINRFTNARPNDWTCVLSCTDSDNTSALMIMSLQ